MLGVRFCPRLRDFPDRRLPSIAPVAAYPFIAPLLGKRIRTDIIREQWGDVLRLVGSIMAGHVAKARRACVAEPARRGATENRQGRAKPVHARQSERDSCRAREC